MGVEPLEQGHFTVEVIRSVEKLDLMENEWNRLVDESNCTIFQTFEWIRTWWKHFGIGRSLLCLTVRHGSALVGLVPMYGEHVSFLGFPTAHRLRFIGRPLSDYLDVIAKAGYEESVLKEFAAYLHSTMNEWDVVDFEEIPEGSLTVQSLSKYLHLHRIRAYQLAGPPCPIVHLPDSFDTFLKSLGQNTRAGYRKKLQRINHEFSVQQKTMRSSDENIREGVEKFVAIHDRRWKGLGFPSAFDDVNHKEFHIAVAEKFAAKNWLRLFLLEVNGGTIAASLEFNFKHRIYMYQSNASASEEIMRNSPGLLIKLNAIEQGIGEGMRIYDLLRGDEPYKYDNLKATNTTNTMLRIVTASKISNLRFSIFLFRELLAKIRGRIILEWHEFKRFRITKKPSIPEIVTYSARRIVSVLNLGIKFIADHVSPN